NKRQRASRQAGACAAGRATSSRPSPQTPELSVLSIIDSRHAGLSTRITALTATELQEWLATPQPAVATWVRQTGFKASAGSWLWLPEARGRVAGVLAGVAAHDDPMALAHLPMQLAEGDYSLAETIPAARARRWALGWALGSYQFSRYRKPARAP